MKSWRDTFEENYIAVDLPQDGRKTRRVKYLYYGPWYFWDIPSTCQKRNKLLLGGLFAADAAVFTFVCTIHDPINWYLPVQAPALLSLSTLAFEAFGVARFCIAKERMRRTEYNDINFYIKVFTFLRAVLLFVALLAAIFYMTRAFSPSSLLATGGILISLICSAAIILIFRRIPFRTEKNTSLKEITHDKGHGS